MKKVERHPGGHRDKESFLLSFCKWEFLRRNKQYQEQYHNFCRNHRGKYLPKETIDFFEKTWGIAYPCDYRRSLSIDDIRDLSYQNDYDTALIPNFFKVYPVECRTYEFRSNPNVPWDFHPISEEELAQIDEIDLRVNLLNHKTVIKQEFEKIIDKWQERKKKYKGLPISPMRVDDWEYYWKVYDLRDEHPEYKWGKIAQIVLKRKKAEVSRMDEDKISKAHKRCLELIGGGYRKISL